MTRLLVVCVLLSLPATAAERVAVLGWPGTGATAAADAERLLGACEGAARELTGLSVLRVPAGAERCGAREDCLLALATASGVEHLLVVEPLPPRRKGGLDVDVAWVDAVRGRVARRLLSVAPGGTTLARDVRPVVAALVPDFARKGWGGLVAPDAVRLRVDGRMTEPGDVVALPAGPHEVDLLPRSGGALLTREQVLEGVRRTLTATEPGPLVAETGRARGRAGLRVASAVTFSLGALAVAGGLVAGGFSRSALGGLRPCTDNPRDCSSFAAASLAHEQAGRQARTGNVLVGVGGGLLGVGAGLFVFDLLSTPAE